MIQIVLQGILIGAMISTSAGPTFITLVETSITNGVKKAMALAVGVLISDAAYILLSHYGIDLFHSGGSMMGVKIAGGAVFLFMGAKKLTTDEKTGDETTNAGKLSYFKSFVKGFAVNGLNPFLLVFWTGIVGLYKIKTADPSGKAILFYTGILLTTFSCDILKVVFADKVKIFFSGKYYHWMMRIFGWTFICIGFMFISEIFGWSIKDILESSFANIF